MLQKRVQASTLHTMALKPLLLSECLFQRAGCTLSFGRFIKTEGSRKGKISVTKRKFVGDEKSFEILELKDSSSVIKRFNWENNKLFGGVINVAQHCYYKTCKIVKPTPAESAIKSKNSVPVVDDTRAIPIKNVMVCSDFSENSVSGHNNIVFNSSAAEDSDIVSKITDFPLYNVMPRNSKDAKSYVDNLNYLRQHLLKLCKSENFPSVTTILEKTMPPESKAALAKWRSDMIKKMGLENFQKYHDEMLESGSSFHNNIYTYLSGVPESDLTIDEMNKGYWTSLKDFLLQVKNAKFLEEHVTHEFLCYRGVVDCYARYKNNFVLIDWKTSRKYKPTLESMFDSPLQLAAYAGAMHFDNNLRFMVNSGVIAVAYSNGRPASIHYMDGKTLLLYWNEWLKRLQSYWESLEIPAQSIAQSQM